MMNLILGGSVSFVGVCVSVLVLKGMDVTHVLFCSHSREL